MGDIQSCFKRVEKKYLLTYEQYEAMRRVSLNIYYHLCREPYRSSPYY